MHDYLTSIGFSEYNTTRKIRELRDEVINNPSRKSAYASEKDTVYVYEKDYGECFGLCVIRTGENEKDSEVNSFFPYVRGCNFLFNESFTIDSSSDREGYFGYCEDNNIGIPIIFSINNLVEFRKNREFHEGSDELNCVTLSGLARDGIVLLPIEMDDSNKKHAMRQIEKRNNMINAAKMGNVEARENLTLEDMANFTKVTIRSQREDIFTIVSSYFMPYTVECDKYSVLAEITGVAEMKNLSTREEMYYLSLDCNSIDIEVMINKKDLLGVPEKGRRLKCHLWLQGQMDYL